MLQHNNGTIAFLQKWFARVKKDYNTFIFEKEKVIKMATWSVVSKEYFPKGYTLWMMRRFYS